MLAQAYDDFREPNTTLCGRIQSIVISILLFIMPPKCISDVQYSCIQVSQSIWTYSICTVHQFAVLFSTVIPICINEVMCKYNLKLQGSHSLNLTLRKCWKISLYQKTTALPTNLSTCLSLILFSFPPHSSNTRHLSWVKL